MKKLLGIVVLGLLLSGNAYAEKIKIPITVNIFEMNKPNGWRTITSKADVINDFQRTNEIWSKAGIF